ncbi:unnamed protein product, partial [Amoebophrya sp. A120]|eukprot:GSA120T00000882001.1
MEESVAAVMDKEDSEQNNCDDKDSSESQSDHEDDDDLLAPAAEVELVQQKTARKSCKTGGRESTSSPSGQLLGSNLNYSSGFAAAQESAASASSTPPRGRPGEQFSNMLRPIPLVDNDEAEVEESLGDSCAEEVVVQSSSPVGNKDKDRDKLQSQSSTTRSSRASRAGSVVQKKTKGKNGKQSNDLHEEAVSFLSDDEKAPVTS